MDPSWLWVGNMRLSTALLFFAFLFVGMLRRDFKSAILAGMTWLLGWEIAWQFTNTLHTNRTLGWNVILFLVSAAIVLVLQRFMAREGRRSTKVRRPRGDSRTLSRSSVCRARRPQ